MSRFRRFELIEPCYYSPPSLSIRETSIFAPKTLALPSFLEEDLDLDFLSPSPFGFFDAVTDLVRIDETPSFSSYRRIQKVERHGAESLYLQSLSDRVSQLESRFNRLVKGVDRKYTWTAEIKDGSERTYKWTAEIKDGKKKKEEEVVVKRGGVEKNYKWTAEIKRNRKLKIKLRDIESESESDRGKERLCVQQDLRLDSEAFRGTKGLIRF